MKKHQISIPVLLPSVPDEKDHCVEMLIDQLQDINGIEKVHIVDSNGSAHLCFHYDTDKITLRKIDLLARKAGAELTGKYGHELLEVKGIRHARHARQVEGVVKKIPGVMNVSVSGSGFIRMEYERENVNLDKIIEALEGQNLQVTKRNISEHEWENGKNEDRSAMRTCEYSVKADEHHHDHSSIFGERTEIIFSLISGTLLAVGYGLSFFEEISFYVSLSFYIGAYIFGGYYTSREVVTSLAIGRFNIDILMFIAALGAAIIGVWAEGALLLFLFSLAHALEHYAMGKAGRAIKALSELSPKTSLKKEGEQIVEIDIDDIKIDDILVVRPHTKIAADGYIVSGRSVVNQAPITGESIPVDKSPFVASGELLLSENEIPEENRVFAGTINGNNTLEIKVLKETKDSTLSRLIKLVQEAQTQKSPTQHFADKFEKYFVPSVLVLVLLLIFAFLVINEPFSKSFYRAMAVLVAASPCALAISTPSAVLSGVARAARGGVLIKGGRPLETLGNINAIAFDKTGTLTEGRPRLTEVISLGDYSKNEILRIAVAVENLSDHPLARALVRDGLAQLGDVNMPAAEDLEAVLGKGIKAKFEGDEVFIGNLELFTTLDGVKPNVETHRIMNELSSGGNTTMLVRKGVEYIGIIGMMDTPRAEARPTIEKLKSMGIKRMIMLTGDTENVGKSIAKQIGLTDVFGNLLPEQKVDAIKQLSRDGLQVAMVGDGVNDAPAMASSSVGIAMGAAGSDVALETADVALMADKLEALPFAVGLSRKTKAIIKQNLVISLGMVALLIPLTVSGIATIGPAVLLHEGSTVVVVFNALRLLAYNQ